jgi:type II secretory pathway pseudopilin PulG
MLKRSSRGRFLAFSIVELLMTIALIGLVAAAVVGPDSSMFSGIGDEPLEETLRRAVREARYQSAFTGHSATLAWDDEERVFLIRDNMGTGLACLKSDVKLEGDGVTFQRLNPTQGQLPSDTPTESVVTILSFEPDRSSTPFVALVRYAGEEKRIRFDAFSNLRMEAPGEK